MGTIFLWLVLCVDGQVCESAQVYRLDSFKGVSARSDCRREYRKVSAKVQKAAPPGSRVVCKTLAEFNETGVTL